jgi:hypothetical protein
MLLRQNCEIIFKGYSEWRTFFFVGYAIAPGLLGNFIIIVDIHTILNEILFKKKTISGRIEYSFVVDIGKIDGEEFVINQVITR